ncbi:MAG: hypothetical protein ACLFUS_01830 [Candidatus Sumerlaeia bacterium]
MPPFTSLFAYLVYIGFWVVTGALVFIELGHFYHNHKNPTMRHLVIRRFVRRMTGVVILAAILVLLVYPPNSGLDQKGQLIKMLSSLSLCILLFLFVLWDFRSVRRDLREEVKNLMDQSARELRQYMEKVKEEEEQDKSS